MFEKCIWGHSTRRFDYDRRLVLWLRNSRSSLTVFANFGPGGQSGFIRRSVGLGCQRNYPGGSASTVDNCGMGHAKTSRVSDSGGALLPPFPLDGLRLTLGRSGMMKVSGTSFTLSGVWCPQFICCIRVFLRDSVAMTGDGSAGILRGLRTNESNFSLGNRTLVWN